MPRRTFGSPPASPPPPPPPPRPRFEFDVSWDKAELVSVGALLAVGAAITAFAMIRFDAVRPLGIVELEGSAKDIVLGGIALACGAAALVLLAMLLLALVSKRLLVLTDNLVTGPASYRSMRRVSIPLRQVACEVRTVRKQRFLVLSWSGPERIRLGEKHFRDPGGLDKFLAALEQQAAA